MSEESNNSAVMLLGKTFHGSDVVEDGKALCSNSSPTPFRLILMKDAAHDVELQQICQFLNVPVSVEDGFQTEKSNNVLSIYVVNSFDGVESNGLNYRILGRTAFLELVKRNEETNSLCSMFLTISKPLYCHSLSGHVICFTGFKYRDELLSLKQLINYMGGKVRKEINSEVTHLVAKQCKGEKYAYAILFRVPVVSQTWIYDYWENRNVVDFNATNSDFVSKYLPKLFYGARICFLGFPEDEKNHMIERLIENGGEPTDSSDSTCTHLVVNNSKTMVVEPLKLNKTYIVTAAWFWSSIEYEYRKSEFEFKFEHSSQQGTSSCRTRKRRRLKDIFSSFNSDLSPGQLAQNRRSSTSDATRLSKDTETPTREKSKNTNEYHRFLELHQTERNYVGILKTIMTLFKSDLEEKLDTKDQLLNATQIKIIFGHVPLIYEIHCKMLEELNQMSVHWNDENSIGNLIVKYSDDFEKAYSPYINFIENAKEMLKKCDRTNPKFHAFLKVRRSRPECGRQSIEDLLISPVQRLPKIKVLIGDLLSNTNKNSVDYEALEEAFTKIKTAMTHINEDKRKTEGQFALFDIFNDIENCPAYLVSSQRYFISRCEVTELSDNLSGKGNPLVLFLFSDVIEVCKKRTKTFNRENSTSSLGSKHGNIKLYKHVKLLPLSAVSEVMDIKETDDCHNVFALMAKCYQEIKQPKDKVYSFTITDDAIDKTKYLSMLCTQIANALCRTDSESYLTYLEANQLDIVSSEVTTATLGKTFNKFATKTKVKVGRALSINETPNKIRRAA